VPDLSAAKALLLAAATGALTAGFRAVQHAVIDGKVASAK
jgi:hypothetical protein